MNWCKADWALNESIIRRIDLRHINLKFIDLQTYLDFMNWFRRIFTQAEKCLESNTLIAKWFLDENIDWVSICSILVAKGQPEHVNIRMWLNQTIHILLKANQPNRKEIVAENHLFAKRSSCMAYYQFKLFCLLYCNVSFKVNIDNFISIFKKNLD